MTPQQAVAFFRSRSALAKACKVTLAAVYNWHQRGWIPFDRQCEIQLAAQAEAVRRRRKTFPLASREDVKVRQAA